MIDFSLVVLKGLIEHNDDSAYFGSTLGLSTYRSNALERGLIKESEFKFEPSDFGKKIYKNLKLNSFPQKSPGRAYNWSKPKFIFPYEPDIRNEFIFNEIHQVINDNFLNKLEKKKKVRHLLICVGFYKEIVENLKGRSWDKYREEVLNLLKSVGYGEEESS